MRSSGNDSANKGEWCQRDGATEEAKNYGKPPTLRTRWRSANIAQEVDRSYSLRDHDNQPRAEEAIEPIPP